MEKEIPLFPLNLVVFPEEELNLHIFEPRYKQLINDCLREKTTFGIPSFVLNKVEYGTEVKITELTKKYEDGRMDIKTTGLHAFRVKDFQNPWSNKLYSGGIVEFPVYVEDSDPHLHLQILELSRELVTWLQLEDSVKINAKTTLYTIVHKIGLKLEEEYELLKMTSERRRQEFVRDHLRNIIPMLERIEKARERIKLNGHFKHLDPLKF